MTQGAGLMTIRDNCFVIAIGDTVLIVPGVVHCVQATGE